MAGHALLQLAEERLQVGGTGTAASHSAHQFLKIALQRARGAFIGRQIVDDAPKRAGRALFQESASQAPNPRSELALHALRATSRFKSQLPHRHPCLQRTEAYARTPFITRLSVKIEVRVRRFPRREMKAASYARYCAVLTDRFPSTGNDAISARLDET